MRNALSSEVLQLTSTPHCRVLWAYLLKEQTPYAQ